MKTTESQDRELREQYDVFIGHRKLSAKAYSAGEKGFPYNSWLRQVGRFEVELKGGGRATIRDPGETYWVEVQWLYDKASNTLSPIAVHLFGTTAEPVSPGTVKNFAEYAEAYYAALRLKLDERDDSWTVKVPRKRPKPGQAIDVDFYRRLLTVYNHLVKEGHPSPAIALAQRMGENPGTVRSWIHRGRKIPGTQPPERVT